jgi:hypothetical protein
MNKRQKKIIRDFATVIVITFIVIFAVINFKDWINQSEAMLAMKNLGQIVLKYRKESGFVPPQTYIDNIKEDLKGQARLGDLRYRALWIDMDCTDDEILAYTEKNYRSLFFQSGYIVLRLDGRVEWMEKVEFEKLLAKQQKPGEIQMQKRQ